jgi:hypothetical protein
MTRRIGFEVFARTDRQLIEIKALNDRTEGSPTVQHKVFGRERSVVPRHQCLAFPSEERTMIIRPPAVSTLQRPSYWSVNTNLQHERDRLQ